jgi:Flp pilus assembly protein TadD
MDEAQRLYHQALTHRRTAGDLRGEAETLSDLGAVAHETRSYAEANRLYHESLVLYRAVRYPYGIAIILNNLGELAEVNGDPSTAIAFFLHAQRILRDLQSADERIIAEHLQRLREQLGAERFAELRQAAERTKWEEIVEQR